MRPAGIVVFGKQNRQKCGRNLPSARIGAIETNSQLQLHLIVHPLRICLRACALHFPFKFLCCFELAE